MAIRAVSFLLLSQLLLGPKLLLGQGKVDFVRINGTALEIYTPATYSADKKYPVVYFNDGQMLFGHSSMTMSLQVVLDSLIENKTIAELMVVGIAADQYRSEKYVPFENKNFKKMPDGDSYAGHYAQFVLDDVIQYVDKNYSTIDNARGRAIFGFSFGGLHAIWMLLNNPDVFSMAAGLSPSFWVNDFAMFREVVKYQTGQKIWFDIGTAEWNYYVPFQKMLGQQGAEINQDVFYYEVPGGVHNQSDWRKRIGLPLFVFAGTRPHQIIRMRVEIEVIPSQSTPGKKFTRLNPIVICKSGLTYSLGYEASYEVLNPSAGRVFEEGRFELFGTENLEVLVTYLEFSKKVKIRSRLLKD